MRVAFITQWWGINPGGVIAGIVSSLREEGATVDILAGRGGLDGAYEGSRWKLRDRRSWGGSRLTTYPYFRSHDTSGARRLLTYGSFAAVSSLAASDARDYDVVLVYGSPVTAAAPAMVAHVRFGVPYVLHVQDIWPDSIFATGFLTEGVPRRAAESTVGAFVDSAYRRAAAVVGISPGARDLLVSRGVPAAKAHHVYNWVADDESIQAVSIPVRQAGEPLHLMYAGTVGLAQNLDNVLNALALLQPGVVCLTLVGDGPAVDSLSKKVAELGLDNVAFTGNVPRSEVPALQSTAHLNLISLADQELFRITIPSKLQALAAHGAPILCTAPGEVADIVTTNGMGISARPGDPAALADTILKASELTTEELRQMGQNGRDLYAGEMTRKTGAGNLAAILQEAAQQRGRRPQLS